MSIIAWDGKILAADKQADNCGMGYKTTKIFKLDCGDLVGITGSSQAIGLLLIEWYKDGCVREKWPKCQNTDEWARLIVVSKDGKVFFYEREPIPILNEDCFVAWGAGRDFAMGAMAMGASAIQAVEIAISWCIHCGIGIDYFRLNEVRDDDNNAPN